MAIFKNTAGQKIAVFAYDKTTGAAKTGDAANITAYLSKDFGTAAAVTDTNPAELDSTNMPGWYVFDLAQAESNAEVLVLAPLSATANILLDQVQITTADSTVPAAVLAALKAATYDGLTWEVIQAKLVAALFGNTEDNDTSVKTFLAQDGTTAAFTATIDEDGNRVIDLTP